MKLDIDNSALGRFTNKISDIDWDIDSVIENGDLGTLNIFIR